MNPLGWFENLWQDVRHGGRLLRLSPGFFAVAVLSLALGIGANTAIFQLLDAVRLRLLPVAHPEQLAELKIADNDHCCNGNFSDRRPNFTFPQWEQIRQHQQAFSGIFAWGDVRFNLAAGGEARYVEGLWVTGDFFRTLGIQAAAGRLIEPLDDRAGCGSPGTVISYGFWQREFGGDRQAIGKKFSLGGRPFEIIGVAPPGFFGMEVGRSFDVAVPVCAEPWVHGEGSHTPKRHHWWLAIAGRMKPDWTVQRAAAQAEYGHNSVKALHVMIEAKKLAYADLLKYIGDPNYSKMPVAELLSKDVAASRAKLINTAHATCSVTPTELAWVAQLPAADTIYMSAIDREGNMVSLIQSNFGGFGSGVVAPGTGFVLQNRAGLFSLERGHPNALAPHRRPLHTIIPAFLQKGDTNIAFGIMGGWNQSQAHAQFVSNIVDFGMNIQGAMEAARFTKLTFDGCDVNMEARVAPGVIKELESMGHVIKNMGQYSGGMGGGQAVMSTPGGVHFGSSDPRKDGAAVPENPDFKIP